MTVNKSAGPTGPRPASASKPSSAVPAKSAEKKTAEVPAAPTGWKPAARASPVTPRSDSGFASASVRAVAVPPNPVELTVKSAIDRFTTRVQGQLNHDPMSLARGVKPFSNGDSLSAAQQAELKNASVDFIKDMPIGALSPQVAATVQQKLKDANIQVRDLASTKLGDLGNVVGDIGGNIAKDLLKDLKQDSPAVYYGLAASAAAAAGYSAWSQGSAGLQKLGIKPEIKQSFFDNQLSLKLGGDWQAHFKDFKASGTVAANVSLGDFGKVTGSVTASSGLATTGIDNATLGYTIDRPNWNLSANAKFNNQGLETVSGRAQYNVNENLRLSAGVDTNLQTNTTQAFGEAAWHVKKDVDLALSARRDANGNNAVGAGLRIRF